MRFSPSFRQGLHQSLPAALGIFTFGTITGVAVVGAGFGVPAALALGIVVYAGSATLVAMQLVLLGAPLAIIGLAAIVVNLRFVLYSITTEPIVRGRSRRFRALVSYMLSDNGFGLTMVRLANRVPGENLAEFILGANIALYTIWAAGIVVGTALGAAIPPSWSLEFMVTLTFLALGLGSVRDRPMAASFVAAGVVAVLTWDWPLRLGLIAASAAGIATGLAAEGRRAR